MIKKYTVRDILGFNPCDEYNEEKLKSLLPPGKKSLSLAEIMELDFPDVDKIWIACRLLSKKSRCEFACDIAESVLPIFEKKYPEDKRPRNAIETMRKYLDGEIDYAVTDAADAAYAVRAAAYAACAIADAATYAAYNAADAAYAACAAADAATYAAYAVRAAADAATYAAYNAADAATQEGFYADCVNLIILYAVMGSRSHD